MSGLSYYVASVGKFESLYRMNVYTCAVSMVITASSIHARSSHVQELFMQLFVHKEYSLVNVIVGWGQILFCHSVFIVYSISTHTQGLQATFPCVSVRCAEFLNSSKETITYATTFAVNAVAIDICCMLLFSPAYLIRTIHDMQL